MVALRHNAGQPDDRHFAESQCPGPGPARGEMPIKQDGHLHAFELSQQQGNVVDPFNFNQTDKFLNHCLNLPDLFNFEKSLLV